MEDKILLGRSQQIIAMPQTKWKEHLTQIPQHSQTRLNFMTADHHRIRYFAVKELVAKQVPVEPGFISHALNIPLAQVRDILEELERELTFLVRDEHGAVIWAYPVTVVPTPHRLNFSTGERVYAA